MAELAYALGREDSKPREEFFGEHSFSKGDGLTNMRKNKGLGLPFLCAPTPSRVLIAAVQRVHGLRMDRESMRAASSSPMITSLSGSHLIFLRVLMAISLRWLMVSDLTAAVMELTGCERVLMQSRKFRLWSRLLGRLICCKPVSFLRERVVG